MRVAVTKEQANKNKSEFLIFRILCVILSLLIFFSIQDMKCMAFVDPYAAFAAYPYGDYPTAFTSLDPYTYSGYYGCYDYFSATPTPSPATSGYGRF